MCRERKREAIFFFLKKWRLKYIYIWREREREREREFKKEEEAIVVNYGFSNF